MKSLYENPSRSLIFLAKDRGTNIFNSLRSLLTFSRTVSFFLFGSIMSPSVHASFVDDCAAALQKDTTVLSSDYQLQYAYMKRVTSSEQSFSEAKANGSLQAIYGAAAGAANFSYEDAKKYMREQDDQTHLNYDIKESVGYIRSALSIVGAQEFGKCVQTVYGSEGEHFYLQTTSLSRDAMQINAHWTGFSSGANAILKLDIYKVDRLPNGETEQVLLEEKTIPLKAAHVNYTFSIARPYRTTLSIVGNILNANGVPIHPDGFISPPYIKFKADPNFVDGYKLSGNSVAACGDVGDDRSATKGNDVSISAVEGETFKTDTVGWDVVTNVQPLSAPPADLEHISSVSTKSVDGYVICSPKSAGEHAAFGARLHVFVSRLRLIEDITPDMNSNTFAREITPLDPKLHTSIVLPNAKLTTKQQKANKIIKKESPSRTN